MKRRVIILLAVVLTIGFFAMSTPASAATPSDFVSRINALRASHGLNALSVNGTLSSQCQTWAEHMASALTISHNPALGSTPGNWSKVGENVGTGPTVDAIFNAYVNSPEHYRNMVDPDFNSIGVGVANGSDGRIYTCNDFADYPAAKSTTPPTTAKPATVAHTTTTTGKTVAHPTTTVASPAHPTPVNAAASATTSIPTTQASASAPTPTPTPSHLIVTGLQEVGAIDTQG